MSTLREFASNLKRAPRSFTESLFRHGRPETGRTRAQAVFSNVFLHVHAVRTHRYSLRASYTFGLGIMAAMSLLVATVTGIVLMIYYVPHVDAAYDSIKELQNTVGFGTLCRNTHRWSGNLMVAVVMLHMARVFYTAAYKSGRQFNWVVGVGLFILTVGLAYTGYILPWDQLAYWALVIGSRIAASPRELTDALGMTGTLDPGSFQETLFLGASEIGQAALLRLYWLHCIALPVAIALALAVHIWRVRKDGGLARPDDLTERDLAATPTDDSVGLAPELPQQKSHGLMCVVQGSSPAVGVRSDQTVMSWPHLFKAEFVAAALITAVIFAVSIWIEAPLKEMADPTVPENPAKAPWYYLGLQELVSYSAFMGGIGIPSLVLLALTSIPFLDREEQAIGRWFDGGASRTVTLLSVLYTALVTALMLATTVRYGWFRDWFPDIHQGVIIFVNPGTVLVAAYALWSLFVMRRWRSTRMAATAIFTCYLVAFIILTWFAVYHRGPNWEFFWSPADWSVH